MPVPIWDCPSLGLLDEPLDTTTVVSEDIWKKFDMDFPRSFSMDQYYGASADDGIVPETYERSSYTCKEAREIRHHDCMWAGLCISKEHNRTLPAKKDPQMARKIPAGRSLLINRKAATAAAAIPVTGCSRAKNLESDGDSTRPETPQSCESETDSEDEIPPRFKHDSICINEKLTEYLGGDARSVAAAVAANRNGVSVSEVTGQLVRKTPEKKRSYVENERGRTEAPTIGAANFEKSGYSTTAATTCPISTNIGRGSAVSLGDHCYHLNQSSSKKLDHLGVQTPSDSEEEIDVVTCDKSCGRPASLPTNPSAADRQHLQNTVTSALKERQSSTGRPRGRPPSNAPRKRSAQTDAKPAKRARHRNYQKRNSVVGKVRRRSLERNAAGATSPSSSSSSCRRNNRTEKSAERFERGGVASQDAEAEDLVAASQKSSLASTRSSSDDEPDTEKRSLHNNMERQRRIELRNAFEDLRVLVPEVEAKEKAPKVVILRQAAVYCDALTELGQATIARVAELKRKQDRLRTRLSQLRRSFAATR